MTTTTDVPRPPLVPIPRDVAERACGMIDDEHWGQGCGIMPPPHGKQCLEIALFQAIGGRVWIPGSGSHRVRWNDAPGRTAAECRAWLMECADLHDRQKGTQP